jgi:hypothetical protein
LKMLPPFWRNQFYKQSIGMALLGSCLSLTSLAQTTQPPLTTPTATEYPGILQTFETLIQVDNTKFKNTLDELIKKGTNLSDAKMVSQLELEPDFLNSIILNSDAGYIRMASTDKCRFYDTIMADLLKSAEGKLKNIMLTYVTKSGERESAVLNKKNFLNSVLAQECPKSLDVIEQFQIKNLTKTLNSMLFEVPTNRDQCRIAHLSWLNNPKTPYLCQIHEYLKEVKAGGGDAKDLIQRQAVAKVLDGKFNLIQRDYIENTCSNLDNEEKFCNEFFNVSFWSKIAAGQEEKLYAESICRKVAGSIVVGEQQYKQCLARLKKEDDLCLYSGNRDKSLAPHLGCEALSLALNHSSLRSNYRDCPGSSDQLAATNISRLLMNITNSPLQPTEGPCSVVSAGETFLFQQKFDNIENWNLEACYFDKLRERDICSKTFFGNYGNHPLSYSNVVASILRQTRGAAMDLTCTMVDSEDYNPLLLKYKSGCQIVFETNQCFISECKHKILLNDRPIDFIKIKNRVGLEYFPLSIRSERFTLHSLLTRDFKQSARILKNLTAIKSFFKKGNKSVIYGVGCAEDILPGFFKSHAMNQCSALPFIIDGMIQEKDRIAFITRTAADSLQAPRILGWSNIYSAVNSYQQYHPLKLWTLYGLD